MSEACMKGCCICFTGEHVDSNNGKLQVRQNPNLWNVNMCDACCSEGCCGSPMIWGCGQFLPCTCCCTQVSGIILSLNKFNYYFYFGLL